MEATSPEHRSLSTEEALSRVSAYLRCLGLPAESAQGEARRALERCAASSGDLPADLGDAALDDVMSRFDLWLTHLCAKAADPAGCRPGLLAWQLRPLLAETPAIFLRGEQPGDGHLAEPVRVVLGASAEPPVPDPTPSSMPAQSFGPAPQLLRPSFWRGVLARLVPAKRGTLQQAKRG